MMNAATVPRCRRLEALLQTVYTFVRLARLRSRKIPVVLQLNAVECGAACVAMILGYYGRATRVAECRDVCAVGRDGLTARALAEGARHLGLRVKVYAAELRGLKYLPLPAILHWDFNHFVVLERWSPQGAAIIDPALGRRRVTAREFSDRFTGVALALEPGISFGSRRNAGGLPWHAYLFQSVLRHPGLLAQVALASVVLQLFGLVLPFATQLLLDRVIPLHMNNSVTVFAAGIALIVLAQTVIAALRAALLVYLQGRLDAQLMLGFVERLLSLPFRFFAQRTSGDLMMRLSSNAFIREVVTGQSVSMVLDGALVIGYFAILLLRSASLAGAVLVVGALQIGLLLSTQRYERRLLQRSLATQAESQSYLVEALSGIATLKASGTEVRALEKWSDLFFRDLNVSLERQRLSSMLETAMGALRTGAPLLLLLIGAQRVLDASMSIGTMLALNAIAAAFLMPLSSLVMAVQRFRLVGAHIERITDVMEAEPERAAATDRRIHLRGRIELRNVSFRYDAAGAQVLRDVSVTVEPGQQIALVGRTGCGKSTLAMLLLGLYEPSEGEIRYDGVPLRNLDYRDLRRQFGIVMQEPFLFAGSIRQNIAFNDPALSLDDIREASRRAAIDSEIAQMPMGYETLLGERGASLSGGQRQRLSIARALAGKPAVVLFDEATSHLDMLTEQHVNEQLERLRATRIVIAHRLSTIRNADLILVLEDGAIVERGTHAQLLARRGSYARLIQSQLGNEDRAPAAVAS